MMHPHIPTIIQDQNNLPDCITESSPEKEEKHESAPSPLQRTHFTRAWPWIALVSPFVVTLINVASMILLCWTMIEVVTKGTTHYDLYHLSQQKLQDATQKAQADQILVKNIELQKDKQRLLNETSPENIKRYLMTPLPIAWADIKLNPITSSEGFFLELPLKKDDLTDLENLDTAPHQSPLSFDEIKPLLISIASFAKNSQNSLQPPTSLVKGVRITPYALTLHTMMEDDFFQILHALRHQAPFYCSVSHYQLRRTHHMTPEYLETLRKNGPTGAPFLYQGSITFFVITLMGDNPSLSLAKEKRDP